MVFNFKIGFTQWTSRHVGKNLPKQIWGRKDRGLAADVRVLIKFFWTTVLYLHISSVIIQSTPLFSGSPSPISNDNWVYMLPNCKGI